MASRLGKIKRQREREVIRKPTLEQYLEPKKDKRKGKKIQRNVQQIEQRKAEEEVARRFMGELVEDKTISVDEYPQKIRDFGNMTNAGWSRIDFTTRLEQYPPELIASFVKEYNNQAENYTDFFERWSKRDEVQDYTKKIDEDLSKGENIDVIRRKELEDQVLQAARGVADEEEVHYDEGDSFYNIIDKLTEAGQNEEIDDIDDMEESGKSPDNNRDYYNRILSDLIVYAENLQEEIDPLYKKRGKKTYRNVGQLISEIVRMERSIEEAGKQKDYVAGLRKYGESRYGEEYESSQRNKLNKLDFKQVKAKADELGISVQISTKDIVNRMIDKMVLEVAVDKGYDAAQQYRDDLRKKIDAMSKQEIIQTGMKYNVLKEILIDRIINAGGLKKVIPTTYAPELMENFRANRLRELSDMPLNDVLVVAEKYDIPSKRRAKNLAKVPKDQLVREIVDVETYYGGFIELDRYKMIKAISKHNNVPLSSPQMYAYVNMDIGKLKKEYDDLGGDKVFYPKEPPSKVQEERLQKYKLKECLNRVSKTDWIVPKVIRKYAYIVDNPAKRNYVDESSKPIVWNGAKFYPTTREFDILTCEGTSRVDDDGQVVVEWKGYTDKFYVGYLVSGSEEHLSMYGARVGETDGGIQVVGLFQPDGKNIVHGNAFIIESDRLLKKKQTALKLRQDSHPKGINYVLNKPIDSSTILIAEQNLSNAFLKLAPGVSDYKSGSQYMKDLMSKIVKRFQGKSNKNLLLYIAVMVTMLQIPEALTFKDRIAQRYYSTDILSSIDSKDMFPEVFDNDKISQKESHDMWLYIQSKSSSKLLEYGYELYNIIDPTSRQYRLKSGIQQLPKPDIPELSKIKKSLDEDYSFEEEKIKSLEDELDEFMGSIEEEVKEEEKVWAIPYLWEGIQDLVNDMYNQKEAMRKKEEKDRDGKDDQSNEEPKKKLDIVQALFSFGYVKKKKRVEKKEDEDKDEEEDDDTEDDEDDEEDDEEEDDEEEEDKGKSSRNTREEEEDEEKEEGSKSSVDEKTEEKGYIKCYKCSKDIDQDSSQNLKSVILEGDQFRKITFCSPKCLEDQNKWPKNRSSSSSKSPPKKTKKNK